MTRLERLHVEAFRGIVDSSLPFDCGSIVLGGGNGTGKTAFVDAVEFLYTGAVSTLEGTQGLSLRHHGPHIHATPHDTHVSADFDQPHFTLTRRLGAPPDVPAALEPHLQEGGQLSFILRRSQLQQFIHAKPADRYRSMAELIGADSLDRTELGLKRARDELERSMRGAEARLLDIEARLAALPEDALDERELLAQANDSLADLGFGEQRLESFGDLDAVRAAILRGVTERRPDPRAEARARLLTELQRGVGQEPLRNALATYRELTPDAGTGANRSQMLDLLNVLRRGRDYLRETETDRCPLCQQEIEARALLSRLTKRVAELEEVSLFQQRLDRARDELEAVVQDTSGRIRALERALTEAGISDRATGALENAVSMLRESMRAGAPIESMEMAGRVADALARWETWCRESVAALQPNAGAEPEEDVRTQAANSALALLQQASVQRAQAARDRQERERLQGEWNSLQSAIAQRKRALELAHTAYVTFNRVKNEEIQRIYDDLRDDLARFYDFLHPGEGHGALSIEMDPRKRGSSDLRMGFYGRGEEDPRAFGSEGHLDSLGLCIFLAFVRRFNGDWPLLVLDDVVPSIDAPHKQRVATLLFQEFGDHQLFITTHDARWFNDLRRAQQETGREQETKNLVIDSWSLDEGPKVRPAA